MPHSPDDENGGQRAGLQQILQDPHHVMDDLRLLEMSLRNRWGKMDETTRGEVVDKLREILAKDSAEVSTMQGTAVVSQSKVQVAAARCLIAIEAQNQADDFELYRAARLDAGKPTANVVTSNPTLDNLVQRLLSQRVPEHLWPPLVREHRKLIESKQL